MTTLLLWCCLPAATVALLLGLRRAYSRHASRGVLLVLALGTLALALASAVAGSALLVSSLATSPFALDAARFATGLLLAAVGLPTALLVGDAFRRVRAPTGRLRIAPGDVLPPLPVLDADGAPLDASKLLGPGGALLVWYRGFT